MHYLSDPPAIYKLKRLGNKTFINAFLMLKIFIHRANMEER